ncbi:MAG: DUF6472 family protein [Lachnospiraceae bacterium]|nr:DUF6472 family protein [Lachnospiraceae bacterium]
MSGSDLDAIKKAIQKVKNKTAEEQHPGKRKAPVGNCDSCTHYLYDEESESYYCDINLDEDEMYHFLTGSNADCAYYESDNEYLVVRHQM